MPLGFLFVDSLPAAAAAAPSSLESRGWACLIYRLSALNHGTVPAHCPLNAALLSPKPILSLFFFLLIAASFFYQPLWNREKKKERKKNSTPCFWGPCSSSPFFSCFLLFPWAQVPFVFFFFWPWSL